jgi:uncharacterized membrane protein YjgN (DUF898 family)
MVIGCPAIFLLACGGFFISTMQAILTSQYAKHRQGECSGVISQIGLITIIPSYGIALCFSYTLSSTASFFWPGISFGMVRFSCINILKNNRLNCFIYFITYSVHFVIFLVCVPMFVHTENLS